MHIDVILFRLLSYIIYYWRAQSNLYIHSPFIFDWVNKIQSFRNRRIDSIQNYRESLLEDSSEFEFIDFGKINFTNISARYLKTSINEFYGKVLMATSSYLKANSFLELGTSFGVSTTYLCASNYAINGTTIDFNPMAIEKSKELFNKWFPEHRVNFVNGNFEGTLPAVLDELGKIDFVFIDGDHQFDSTIDYVAKIKMFLSENAVIVLDDIRWSRGMFDAWQELIQLPEFNYTVDYGRIGFLFKINNHSPKQHFYIH